MKTQTRVNFAPPLERDGQKLATGADLLVRQQTLRADLASEARSLRPFAITKKERYVCDGVSQGTGLSLDGLEVLCELAARKHQAHPFEPIRLTKLLERAILERMFSVPALCVFEAGELEQESNGRFDQSQFKWLRERTSVRLEQAIDDARIQYHRTAQFIVAAIRHVRRLGS